MRKGFVPPAEKRAKMRFFCLFLVREKGFFCTCVEMAKFV